MSSSITTQNMITSCEYLPFEEIQAMFVGGNELKLDDPRHNALESAFKKVCQSYIMLKQQLNDAKNARGQTVTQGTHGLIWQRDRAFLVTIVKLGNTREKIADYLALLLSADEKLRIEALGSIENVKVRTLVASNLRCAYEIYEEASSICIEAELFLTAVESAAWEDGTAGIEHLRIVPPGFNRDWVLKVSARNCEGPVRYTIGQTMYDQPPEGLRLSNFDIDKAISLVGAREFKDGSGWIALYRPECDYTGPKRFFQFGAELHAEKKVETQQPIRRRQIGTLPE